MKTRIEGLQGIINMHSLLCTIEKSLDDLGRFKFYRQSLKKAGNLFKKEVSTVLDGYYEAEHSLGITDDEGQKIMLKRAEIFSNVLDIMKEEKNIHVFYDFIECYKNGELEIADEKAMKYAQSVMPNSVTNIRDM